LLYRDFHPKKEKTPPYLPTSTTTVVVLLQASI
jgi:hypothetical protein